MSDRLPLLADQADRLAIQLWVEREGFGEEPRMLASGYRLQGPLDVDVLRRCFEQLRNRHGSLRAIFPARGQHRYQLVAPRGSFDLPLTDLTGGDPSNAATLAGNTVGANGDLEQGDVFRGHLVRLGHGDHILGVGVDHLVADGQSFTILMRELWQMYGATVANTPPALPQPEIEYEDLLRWEQAWLSSDDARHLLDRARTFLSGVGPNPGILLRGANRDANGDYAAGVVKGHLTDTTQRVLIEYCKRRRTTPYVVLATVLLGTLQEHTGRSDLGILVPVTRRSEKRMLRLVSFISSYATLPARVDSSLRFDDLVDQMNVLMASVRMLGRLPGPVVTNALAPHQLGRLLKVPSVFFDLSQWWWSGGPQEIGSLVVSPVDLPDRQSQIESLELTASAFEDGIRLETYFPVDVYDERLVSTFMRTFEQLAAASLSEPSRSLTSLLKAGSR